MPRWAACSAASRPFILPVTVVKALPAVPITGASALPPAPSVPPIVLPNKTPVPTLAISDSTGPCGVLCKDCWLMVCPTPWAAPSMAPVAASLAPLLAMEPSVPLAARLASCCPATRSTAPVATRLAAPTSPPPGRATAEPMAPRT